MCLKKVTNSGKIREFHQQQNVETMISLYLISKGRWREEAVNPIHNCRIFITDRVRSTREGYVLTRVCPSVCLSTGGVPHLARWGGGTPAMSSQGVPQSGGYLRWSTPQGWGTPGQVRMGVPKMGYPQQGWGTLWTGQDWGTQDGIPPSRDGVPPGRDRVPPGRDGVPPGQGWDTPASRDGVPPSQVKMGGTWDGVPLSRDGIPPRDRTADGVLDTLRSVRDGVPPGRDRVPPGRDGVPPWPGMGYPCQQGWGTPQPGQDGGYLRWGTPEQGWGTPLARDGIPPRDRTADGVLDTPRPVCLLRSRRRTFLCFNENSLVCLHVVSLVTIVFSDSQHFQLSGFFFSFCNLDVDW